MSFYRRYKQGFTLIELLVVAIIIVTLAGVGVFSYQNAKMRARDYSRKQDLNAIMTGLIAWKTNNPSISYPHCTQIPWCGPFESVTKKDDYTNYVESDFVPMYFKKIPVDQFKNLVCGTCSTNYQYTGLPNTGSSRYENCSVATNLSDSFSYYSAQCTSFRLIACLENTNDKNRDITIDSNCAGWGAGASYTVESPQ